MPMRQRELFCLLDQLTATSVRSPEDLLRFLVRQIVDHPDLQITGGRIWKLDPPNRQYVLLYQYGNVQKIPEDYALPLAHSRSFREIVQHRVVVRKETHQTLRRSGIHLYSAAGVGKLIRIGKEKFFEYVLAFNAPKIDQEFYFLLNVIRNIANVRLRELEAQQEQEIIEKDLRQAREIQQKLLPDHEATFADYEVFGVSVPDRVVGGDYFDYFYPSEDPEDRIGIVISDAASKGLPAAIQALYVAGALRMGVAFYAKMSALIARLNDLLCRMFHDERFVTLFYCELTASKKGLVLYVNAGHTQPIHYRAQQKQTVLLDVTGGVLGVVPKQRFQVENINMRPGDFLVMYTDGISEARDAQGNFFGEERIRQLVEQHSHLSAREMAYKILEAVQQFSAGARYTDDRTVVVVKRKLKQ